MGWCVCGEERYVSERTERPEKLDEILMVGGSSRIPIVGHRLEAEFRKKPKLVEPDLCVALGAALMAGARRTVTARLFPPCSVSYP